LASTIKVTNIDTPDNTGNITVDRPLAGSGASLTALNATNLASGTVATARLGSGTANNTVFLRGDNTWAAAGSTSASDLTSGTLPMARLSGTLPALNGSALTALNATQLTSGTIPIARIADDAVTLAKMAPGTDGQIITYDASGDPVAVGPGTDGQVLTSTGAGSPPAFEDAAGGVDGITSSANTTAISISADEEVTMPLQPCFFAVLTSRANNATGNGAQWNTQSKTFTEIYDIGSNFSNGVFTAPVTGKYIIFGSFYFINTASNHNQTIIYLTTSNRTYNALRSHGYNIFPYQGSFAASVVADMDAADTFHMSVNMYGGSLQVHVEGTGASHNNTVMGAALIA